VCTLLPLTLSKMHQYLILWDKFRLINRPKTCRGASLTQLWIPEHLVVHILSIFSVRKRDTNSCIIVKCSSLKAKLEEATYKTFGTIPVQRKTCSVIDQDPFCLDQKNTLMEFRISSTYSLLNTCTTLFTPTIREELHSAKECWKQSYYYNL
jgi:hypothetical protein